MRKLTQLIALIVIAGACLISCDKKEDGPAPTPEYTLRIVANPTDATILINDVAQNSITVAENTEVTYSVSAEGYVPTSGKHTVIKDETLTVTLTQQATLTIVTTPENAVVTINDAEQNSITVDPGTEIAWTVSADGYYPQEGTYTVTQTESINVDLVSIYTEMSHVSVSYLGTRNETAGGNFTIVLYNTENPPSWDNSLSEAGQALSIRLACEPVMVRTDGDPDITGEYSAVDYVSEDTYAPGSWVRGQQGTWGMNGSLYTICEDGTTSSTTFLREGSVTISQEDGIYTITVSMTDSEETEILYSYHGEISISTTSAQYPVSSVSMTCYYTGWNYEYSSLKIYQGGYFQLQISSDDYMQTGVITAFTQMPVSGEDIPDITGTYTVNESTQAGTWQPGVQGTYGPSISYYTNNTTYQSEVFDGGTFEITKNDNGTYHYHGDLTCGGAAATLIATDYDFVYTPTNCTYPPTDTEISTYTCSANGENWGQYPGLNYVTIMGQDNNYLSNFTLSLLLAGSTFSEMNMEGTYTINGAAAEANTYIGGQFISESWGSYYTGSYYKHATVGKEYVTVDNYLIDGGSIVVTSDGDNYIVDFSKVTSNGAAFPISTITIAKSSIINNM